MQNTKFIIVLIIGIIIGYVCHSRLACHPRSFACHPRESGDLGEKLIKIHDTLKTLSVQYKIIPGSDYNIDSLTFAINQFWKDSLKNMYGKGLFQTQFQKEDKLGKRTYTLESRIPVDPMASLAPDPFKTGLQKQALSFFGDRLR